MCNGQSVIVKPGMLVQAVHDSYGGIICRVVSVTGKGCVVEACGDDSPSDFIGNQFYADFVNVLIFADQSQTMGGRVVEAV